MTLTKSLDYEKNKRFNFVAQINSEFENKALFSFSIITINIMDVNDNAPVFKTIYKKLVISQYFKKILYFSLEISESTLPGTIIAVYLATDLDSQSTNSQIVYSLEVLNNKTENAFTMDPEYGWLMISSGGLDREIQNLYHLRITAKDEGGLKTQQYLDVKILDFNDSPPKFGLSEYFAELNIDAHESFKKPILKFNVTVSYFLTF